MANENVVWKKFGLNAWNLVRKDGEGEPLAQVVEDQETQVACFQWAGEKSRAWFTSVAKAMTYPTAQEIEARL